MKNRILTSLLCLLAITTSCDLDKYPSSSIEQSQAFKTLKDASTIRTGLYSLLRNATSGRFIYNTDFQSDLLNATLDYGNRGGLIYRWEFIESDVNLRDYWQVNYQLICNVNSFLDNASKIAPLSTTEQSQLDIYIGEASLMRALAYHNLVIRYAKDYEPSTAASTHGLPIVLTYDPNAKPARATLEQTYQQIKADISVAKEKLTTAGASNSYYLTEDAVKALEARVALYSHDWNTAISASNDIIAKYPLADNVDEILSIWRNDSGSEIITKLFMSSNELSGQMNVYITYNTSINSNVPDFVPQQWVVDLYSDDDIRKLAYLKKEKITIQGREYNEVYMINKYPGNPALWTTAVSNYYHMVKLFRSAEAYLIKAEAAYRANQPLVAVSALNSLREKRGISALSTSLTGTELFAAIQEERTREMLCEGTRLDDLKRWGLGFQRGLPQNVGMVSTGTSASGLSVQPNNQRFVWEIPANDLQTNENLVPNWQ